MNKSAAMPGYTSAFDKSKQLESNILPANRDYMPFYDMPKFLHPTRSKISINDVSIQMIYSDQIPNSAIKPFLRSENIINEILRFSLSSLLSFLIDIGLFSLIFRLLSTSTAPMALLAATGLARVVSSGFNFTLNKNFVFKNSGSTRSQLMKYYLLCTLQMFCSWLILYGLSSLINEQLVLLKIITDTFLLMISFIVQRLFIFRRTIHFEKEK